MEIAELNAAVMPTGPMTEREHRRIARAVINRNLYVPPVSVFDPPCGRGGFDGPCSPLSCAFRLPRDGSCRLGEHCSFRSHAVYRQTLTCIQRSEFDYFLANLLNIVPDITQYQIEHQSSDFRIIFCFLIVILSVVLLTFN